MYVPDSNLVQDDDESEPAGRSASTMGADHLGHDENPTHFQTSHVVITTTKVSCWRNSFKGEYSQSLLLLEFIMTKNCCYSEFFLYGKDSARM
jgi:hypothetical protein